METKKTGFLLENFSTYRNAIYGVAALWVMMFHGTILKLIIFPESLSKLKVIFNMGHVGVDMFLFLSGMGLYQSFRRDSRIGHFYYKRLIRIFIPFLLIALPQFIRECLIVRVDIPVFFQMVTTLSFWTRQIHGSDLWYVAAILVFYLLYPLIYKFIFREEKGQLERTLSLIAIVVAGIVALYYARRDLYDNWDIALTRLPVFLLGCWAGKPIAEKKTCSWAVLAASLAIALTSVQVVHFADVPGWVRRFYGSISGVSYCFILGELFCLLRKLKIDRFFAVFGGVSLEIYISHIVLRWYFSKMPLYENVVGTENFWRYYFIVVPIALVVAFVAGWLGKLILKLLRRKPKPQKESGA